MMSRTLILTAPYGNGHLQPARVLHNQFVERGGEVEIYDIVSETNPIFSKISQNIYKQMYRNGLRRVYQFSYWASDNQVIGHIVSYILRYANKNSLFEKILEYNPTEIICVFPSWALYQMLEDYDIFVPVYTIVTDFYMHKLWYHPSVKKYFVANEWTYEFTNYTVDKTKFIATGLPIRKEFEEYHRKRTQNEQLKNTVLLLAGANGVNTQYLHLAEMVYKLPYDLKVILICGKNKSLYKQAMYKASKYDDSRFVVHGYVDDMIEKYKASDLVVTKSGGNTVSELAAMALPAIFYAPLFGQEMANAEFFVAHHVAKIVMSTDEALEQIITLYKRPKEIIEMRKGYEAFFRPNAAERIVSEILGEDA